MFGAMNKFLAGYEDPFHTVYEIYAENTVAGLVSSNKNIYRSKRTLHVWNQPFWNELC